MPESLGLGSDYFLIAIGSILGASLRLHLIHYSFRSIKSNLSKVLFLNIIATFLLGLFLSSKDKLLVTNLGNSVFILISIGFLGSFSTFSSFIFELYYFLKKNNFKEGIIFISSALFSSLIAVFLGYKLANG